MHCPASYIHHLWGTWLTLRLLGWRRSRDGGSAINLLQGPGYTLVMYCFGWAEREVVLNVES